MPSISTGGDYICYLCSIFNRSVFANTQHSQASLLQEAQSEQIDVSSIFVDIAFRSTPWAQEKVERESSRTAARILFVSESNVCRSVLAEVLTQQILQDRGLSEEILCESKGTRQAINCQHVSCRYLVHVHVFPLLCCSWRYQLPRMLPSMATKHVGGHVKGLIRTLHVYECSKIVMQHSVTCPS